MSELVIIYEAPIFEMYLKENGGFLNHDTECHALMYYALLARKAYEINVIGEGLQYEGIKDNETNFKDLIISVAEMYGVKPEKMTNYWQEVDNQFFSLGLPNVPKEEQYRFNKRIEVITRH